MKFSILRSLPKIIALQNRTVCTTSRLSYVLRSQVLYAKDKKGGDGGGKGGGGGDKKCDDKNTKKPDTKKYDELSKKCMESVAKKDASSKDKCKDKDEKKAEPKCKEVKVECKKKEDKKEADMTAVKGGSGKCKDKKKKKQKRPKLKPKKKLSCEELLMKQAGMSTSKCGDDLKEIRGGNVKCPRKNEKPKLGKSHKTWQRISLFAAIPACILIALFVFQTHEEIERGDFVPYTYKYKQTKGWFIKDPRKTPFHNPKINALPEGYEDEIDQEAGDEPPETDKQKAERKKEADNVRKAWNKKFAAREKEIADAAAAAAAESGDS